MKQMLDENWTKLTSRDEDIPAFLTDIERVKKGETMECTFCGGTSTGMDILAGFSEKEKEAASGIYGKDRG